MTILEQFLCASLTTKILIGVSILLGSLYVYGRYKFSAKPGEPPLVPYLIPWVGNVIPFAFYYEDFLKQNAKKYNGRPFTLHAMGKYMTCFNDADSAATFYRNPDFGTEAVLEAYLTTAFGIRKEVSQWARPAFMYPMYAKYMTSSDSVAEWTTKLSGHLSGILPPRVREGEMVDLFDWTRHLVYHAGCATMWGPEFPVEESEPIFNVVDENMFRLFQELPYFVIPHVYDARKKLFGICAEYLRNGGARNASMLVKAREEAYEREGLSWEDRASLHFVMHFGSQANTPLAIAWCVVMICRSPSLHAAIRAEIAKSIINPGQFKTSKTPPPFDPSVFDHQKLFDGPLLHAIFLEVVRHLHTGGSMRMCDRDTTVVVQNTPYRIRKGNVTQVVLQHIHHDPTVHASPSTFDPLRFINPATGELDVKSRAYRTGLRLFGGGIGLCPGRTFARNETVLVVAALLWFWDVVPIEGQAIPAPKEKTMQGVQPNKSPYYVRMYRRTRFDPPSPDATTANLAAAAAAAAAAGEEGREKM